jgi:hypothetical protein
MARARVFEVELRCVLCGRGLDIEVDSLAKLPRCGPRCSRDGCGGVLFVASASSHVQSGANPADANWDDDDRPRRGRSLGRRREPQRV